MPSQSKPKIRWDQTQHTQVLRSHFCVIIFFGERKRTKRFWFWFAYFGIDIF